MTFDARYVGQNFELRVPAATAEGMAVAPDVPGAAALQSMFFDVHDRNYGFHNPHDPVEIVNIRLTARGDLPKPDPVPVPEEPASAPEPAGRRPVWFAADALQDTPVYDRAALFPGQTIVGPAVIDQLDATVLVFPGDAVRVDGQQSLIMELRT